MVGISGPYDIVDTGGRLRGMTEDAFGEDPEVWKQATVMTHLARGRVKLRRTLVHYARENGYVPQTDSDTTNTRGGRP